MKTRSVLILVPILAVASLAVSSVDFRATDAYAASTSAGGDVRLAAQPGVTGDAARGSARDATPDAVRLIDFAGHNAVFREGRAMRTVRTGDAVPGTDAVLRHVEAAHVLVEFAADADGPALLQAVSRGAAVERPAAGTIAPAARPGVLVSSVHTAVAPDAVQPATHAQHGKGR